MRRVIPALQDVNVVAIPFNSRPRAISPTDWQQSGHEGTNRAASTASFLAIFKISGIILSTTCETSG